MNISLNSSLLQNNDQFKIGIIYYTKIIVSESPQMIKGRTRLYQENLYFELLENPAKNRPGILEWHNLLQSFGINPNEQTHLAEQLMTQISNEQFIEPVNSAIDLNNFFTLQYEIPIGLYDVSKLSGDIDIRICNDSTQFEVIGGQTSTMNHMICSIDDLGAFGSPLAHSVRTAVTEDTTDLIQLFYLRPSLSENECNQLLQTAGKMFCQIHGGHYEFAQLTSNKTIISI